ncbi:MAG: hypothetical protein EOP28_00495 [Rhodococcus sp. (in: high G+C Gram-positive bacteria)]|nr:MAG: hypothetical protein EOP28_00495 [Rhodococcus sp. (in: high G+C Gram-positive bacteria)]
MTQGMGQYLTEEYGKRMAEHRAQAEKRRNDDRVVRDAQRQAIRQGRENAAEHQRRVAADKAAGNAAAATQAENADTIERAGRGMGRYLLAE